MELGRKRHDVEFIVVFAVIQHDGKRNDASSGYVEKRCCRLVVVENYERSESAAADNDGRNDGIDDMPRLKTE